MKMKNKMKNDIFPIQMSSEDYALGVDDSNGICLACGEIQFGGCEPDAENYRCSECHKPAVMGYEHALICGDIDVIDDYPW
jgi:hypothetical protein